MDFYHLFEALTHTDKVTKDRDKIENSQCEEHFRRLFDKLEEKVSKLVIVTTKNIYLSSFIYLIVVTVCLCLDGVFRVLSCYYVHFSALIFFSIASWHG